MKLRILLITFLFSTYLFVDTLSQTMPLVYDVENTGANDPIPYLPSFEELPVIQALPDPFMWSDGRGRISNFSDWQYRRTEIGAEIQNYEIGEKPVRPDTIEASYSEGTLTVHVIVNGDTLTLASQVILPEGTGPFPAVIGMNSPSGGIPSVIFSSRNIAQITFNHNQVTTYGNQQNSNPYYQIYPHLNSTNTGQYSAWAWGISRLIDGLELVQADLPIDLQYIAVTGCSYAGKMALFAGAFDERIALTISQESGGGGYTTWRVSETLGNVETLNRTDHNWFKEDMFQFGNAVSKLPHDHHELMAMVAPRALLVTGNPDYVWLADESGHVGSKAAQKVYEALGIPDRFGFSILAGHTHCQVPDNQVPEIEAFVEKFLLGNMSANTNVSTSPYNTNLSNWITWESPTLSNDSSYFGKTTLVYPAEYEIGLDTTITFKWNKFEDAEKYFIQVSLDPTFTNVAKIDSTTDTLKTITGLLEGRIYYWRVQVKSAEGAGPWSNVGHFATTITIPAKPELVSAVPYPNRPGWITFTWNKVEYADQYRIQISRTETFATIFTSASTTDTFKILEGFSLGLEYYWRVQASNIGGEGPWSDVWNFNHSLGVNDEEALPKEFSLNQNYPNPFNPTTKIRIGLPQSEVTKVIVYDLLGRKVETLINKELEAGYHEITFNAANLGNGVYFYRMEAGNFIETKKLILLR